MPITFHCPQGHRLTCPDELSGKPGKCPKCGVVVRVPQTGMAVAVASASQAGAAPADEPARAPRSAAEGMTGSDLGADQILFLCPNGHRLHGSASLAGRPGQCPHCSVKFLVPSPDDDEEDERIIEEEPDAPLNDIVIQIDTSGKGGSSKSGKSNAISGSALAAAANPLASLLAQLWRRKAPPSRSTWATASCFNRITTR